MDRLDFVYQNKLEPVVFDHFDQVMAMYDILKDYKNVYLINYQPITFLLEMHPGELYNMHCSDINNRIVRIYNREYSLSFSVLYDNKLQVSIV